MATNTAGKDIRTQGENATLWRLFKSTYQTTSGVNFEKISDGGLIQWAIKNGRSQEQAQELVKTRTDARIFQQTIERKIPSEQSTQPVQPQPGRTQGEGGLASGLGAGMGIILGKPLAAVLEDDEEYEEIERNLKKDWLKKNNLKDFDNKKGLDYLYGSLEDPEATSLQKETEEEFRIKHGKRAKEYDKKRFVIFKDPQKDPTIALLKASIEQEKEDRLAFAKKTSPEVNQEDLGRKIEERAWERFGSSHPQKAQAYASKDEKIQQGLLKQPIGQTVEEGLKGYKKDVQFVPKTHAEPSMPRRAQDTTAILEEIGKRAQRAEQLLGEAEMPSPSIASPSFSPPSEIPPSQSSPEMEGPQGPPGTGPAGNLAQTLAGGLGRKAEQKAAEEVVEEVAKKSIFRAAGFWFGASIAAICLIVLIIVITSGGFGGVGTGGGSITPSSNVSSCTFYRSSDTPSGLQFKISKWSALINEVAAKVGVPPAVLAGILRIECANCFNTSNPEYITNDYDARSSGIAYGVMQFYPPTFEGVFNKHEGPMQELFGKTAVSINTAVGQGAMEPDNILRIYSIKDSLIAAAFKIKDDAGIGSPWDRSAIERVVTAYFTQCPYTSNGKTYNYCDDLWQSVSSCRQTTSSNGIIPSGVGGALIAGWAHKIANDLICSDPAFPGSTANCKDKDNNDAAKREDLRRREIPCDPDGTAGHSYHCWEESPKYDVVGDRGYMQCTEFVWAAFDKAGYNIDRFNLGNAFEWPGRAEKYPEFKVFDNPQELQPGDIIKEGTGIQGAGHLVIVTAVKNNVVRVAQAAVRYKEEDYYIENGRLVIHDVTSDFRCTSETRPNCTIKFIRYLGKQNQ